jgi:hypothetical protein
MCVRSDDRFDDRDSRLLGDATVQAGARFSLMHEARFDTRFASFMCASFTLRALRLDVGFRLVLTLAIVGLI